jgi:hypothetical protein
MKTDINWYQKEIKSTLETLGSSERGLSSDEALKRLAEYGPN